MFDTQVLLPARGLQLCHADVDRRHAVSDVGPFAPTRPQSPNALHRRADHQTFPIFFLFLFLFFFWTGSFEAQPRASGPLGAGPVSAAQPPAVVARSSVAYQMGVQRLTSQSHSAVPMQLAARPSPLTRFLGGPSLSVAAPAAVSFVLARASLSVSANLKTKRLGRLGD